MLNELIAMGLSPRVRGNLVANLPVGCDAGSIPACAGEPTDGRKEQRRNTVYPRVCGGTASPACRYALRSGLSPRVRGNPSQSLSTPATLRSIPACAGEPRTRAAMPPPPKWVYPRVCGGTICKTTLHGIDVGLSPRVRGNPSPYGVPQPSTRSIPACAGEPPRPAWSAASPAVYPRVCGGTEVRFEGAVS